ncbi:hypothetical protein N7474_005042 [Penicillium riverlandense]|uniref:uncharacterized protein n=1 Tax=Penicillium riverlandense TaxID=1903569 RepID=UPI002547A86D|nr:uncharacterized protein N7474_005042 [Penicillium riverlandense]KAJ5819451.1 hypothetical protein N7474_005042 [Penicillium riverlandense]
MASMKLPSQLDLTQFYCGKNIADVPKPAAVLDRAIIRRHCERMKRTIRALNVGFRAHVKTHKTSELSWMQLDKTSDEANFMASTPLEIEMLVPMLKDVRGNHRVNVLYGVPLVPSHVERLAKIALELGKESLSVLIDHPDQLPYLQEFASITGFPACVFVKVDTGYHRAGLPPLALNKNGLLEKLAAAEGAGNANLLGLYSHSSLSYAATTAEKAMAYLICEIKECEAALNRWQYLLPKNRQLVISVGATPQVVCSENLLQGRVSSAKAKELMSLLTSSCSTGTANKARIELHAGVYTVLDMQQISTNARNYAGELEDEIALSVVAEVCSVYNDGEREKPEALVAAGTLALGREPCGNYPGWGILSSWRGGDVTGSAAGDRLFVARISQEHAIVLWQKEAQRKIPLEIGQAVKIFPNHACITAAFYSWYFIVDSETDPNASTIVDVWVRARAPSMDPLLATRYQ